MSRRQRIVISLLLASAAVVLVLAFQWSVDEEDTVVARDPLVTNISPEPGDQALRQDTIFAEIQLPYTGVLKIDGIEVGDPHLQRIQVGSSTRLSYTPGPGTITGVLSSGPHRATVVYWRPDAGRENAREYIWSFDVT